MSHPSRHRDKTAGACLDQGSTRRLFLIGLPGVAVGVGGGMGSIQGAWAAGAQAAAKPFDKEQAETFMRRAIELSRKGWEAGDGMPFGAVIVKDGTIVGESANRRIVTRDATAHAEMEAIRQACKRLDSFNLGGCDLYASAQPCPMCLAATYWARIDRVYYGNSAKDSAAIGFDDDVFYNELMRPPDQRRVPEVQLLGNEALEVFRDFASKQKRPND